MGAGTIVPRSRISFYWSRTNKEIVQNPNLEPKKSHSCVSLSFLHFTTLVLRLDSDSDCKQCSSVLQELENIDDDAEVAGIPIVKLEDKLLAKTVGVFALPAIVFFRLTNWKGANKKLL